MEQLPWRAIQIWGLTLGVILVSGTLIINLQQQARERRLEYERNLQDIRQQFQTQEFFHD